MYYTRQLPTLILLISLFSVTVNAQVIPVIETSISLNETKMSGYQLTLSKSRVQIKDGITSHFSFYPFLPSADKDIVKLEKVNYPPIATSGPVSLYYVLESLDKQLTRMTVVGLDKDQRVISAQDSPDLSLKLLLDMSKMVRRISGKPLNFEAIFQPTRDASSQEVLLTSSGFSNFSGQGGNTITDPGSNRDDGSKIEVLRDSIRMLKRELAEARAQRIVDNSRSDAYADQVEELKSKLDSVEQSPVTVARKESTVMQWAEARLSALVSEMRESRKENQTLMTRLIKSDSLIAAFQAQLRNQGEPIKDEASMAARARVPQLEQEVKRLSVELNVRTEALEAAEKALSAANRRQKSDSASSKQLADAEAENKNLQTQLNQSEAEARKLKEAVKAGESREASLNEKLLANQKVRVEAEKKYEELIREIATIKATPGKSVPDDAELNTLRAELKSSREEINKLQISLNSALVRDDSLMGLMETRTKALSQQLEASEMARTTMEKELIKLNQALAKKSNAPIAKTEANQDETQDKVFEEKLAQSEAEVSRLTEKLSNAEKAAAANKEARKTVEAQLEKLKTQMASAQSDNQQIATLQQENEDLKAQLAARKQETTSLTDQVATSQQAKRDLEDKLQQENDRLNKEIKATEMEKRAAEARVKQLSQQLNDATSENKTTLPGLQQKNQELSLQLEERSGELDMAREELAKARTDRLAEQAKYRKEKETLSRKLAAVQDTSSNQIAKISQLEAQLLIAQTATDKTIPGLNGEIKTLEDKLQARIKSTETLRQQLNEKTQQETALSKRLDASQTELKMTGDELDQLKIAYAELSEEMDAALAKMDQTEESLRAELGEAKEKLTKTESENIALSSEKEDVSNRLQETLNMAEQKKNALNLEITKSEDNLRQVRNENDRLSIEVKQLARDNQKKAALFVNAAERADSLEVVVRMSERKNNLLKASRDSLLTDIALLNPDSEAAQARRLVYQQQLENLYQAQDELAVKQYEISSREKRIDQRERYLSEFEANKDEKTLFQRIKELEKQVQTLEKERFQPLGSNRSNSGAVIIQPTNIDRNRRKVPGFMVTSTESKTYLKEQILLWFRLKGIVASKRNSLRFEQVNIPEISDQMLNIEFSLAVMDGGRSVVYSTFELANGVYINGSSSDLPGKNAEAVLREMFE